jgi:hypothetical protein
MGLWIFVNCIHQPMLKLKAQSGFHGLFLYLFIDKYVKNMTYQTREQINTKCHELLTSLSISEWDQP